MLTAAALGLRLLLTPLLGLQAPFITFYLSNIITAQVAGSGPAVAATILGALATSYFFIPPIYSIRVGGFAEEIWVVLYALVSGTAIASIELRRRAEQRAKEAVTLAEERYHLLLEEAAAREQAQRSHERARQWAMTTLSSIGDAVITTDELGRVTFLNQVAEQLTGWKQSEAAGQPIATVFDIVNEETGRRAEVPVARVLETGLVQGLANHTVLISRAGHRTPIDDSAAPIRDEHGRMHGVVLVFRDISARKQQEVSLRRSNEDLERFAYVASHDLQEPVRLVVTFAELLQSRYKGHLDETADEYLRFTVDNARRMRELIRGLLEYSRAGSQGLALDMCDLSAVVDEVVASLQKRITETGATVERDSLPTVRVDRIKMGQVFSNLISNAIKFRSEAPPHIRITCEHHNGNFHICVRDNGIGFEPEYSERIFEMFERLHGGEKYTGTGIGLAICKRLIESHGGRVWAESAAGQGSTFHLELPSEMATHATSGSSSGEPVCSTAPASE